MSKKTETVEEFLARGGKVTKLEAVNDLVELRKAKLWTPPTEIRKHPWKSGQSSFCDHTTLVGYRKK